MNRYEALIPDNQKPGRLSVYLLHAMPLIPEHALREAFRARDVKMNGVRVTQDAMIQPGAKVSVYTPYQAMIPVVYEDAHTLIVDKPAGISADDDARGGMTLLSVLTQVAGGKYIPRLCHRLDNQTSGLMVLAKDAQTEQILLDAFKTRSMDKKYVCLVRGMLRPDQATKEAYLVKDAAHARVRVITHATPGAKPIRTGYRVLSFDGEVSRVEVDLLTGRTHQIRAHMAFLSHPILGDDVYGDRQFNKRLHAQRLMLCATELTMDTGALPELDGRTFSIPAPF